jgi:hypothetical protein
MGNLWMRIIVRRSRRATWTIVGLALCAMYLSGTIALVDGLHSTTSDIASTFQQGPVIVYGWSDLSTASITQESLLDLREPVARIAMTEVSIHTSGSTDVVKSYAVAIEDPANLLGFGAVHLNLSDSMMGVALGDRFVQLGIDLHAGTSILLESSAASVPCSVTAIYSSSTILSPDWIVINRSALDLLAPDLAGNYSFLVLPQDDAYDREVLESMGYRSQNSMAVINFFELGIYQIEGALWGLILITSIIVSLLVYSTISIEVSMRKDDIRLLKKIGSEPRTVGWLFVGRGTYLALCGGVIGAAAGYFAAHLLISMASLRGLTTLIVPQASAMSLLLPFVVVVLASFVGSSLPSFMAAKEPMGGGGE